VLSDVDIYDKQIGRRTGLIEAWMNVVRPRRDPVRSAGRPRNFG
jgi:hypothetical protein